MRDLNLEDVVTLACTWAVEGPYVGSNLREDLMKKWSSTVLVCRATLRDCPTNYRLTISENDECDLFSFF